MYSNTNLIKIYNNLTNRNIVTVDGFPYLSVDKSNTLLVKDILYHKSYTYDNRPVPDINTIKLWLKNEDSNKGKFQSASILKNCGRKSGAIIFSSGLWYKDFVSWIIPPPKNFTLIGCNRVLDEIKCKSFYMANNPYKDVCSFLPFKKAVNQNITGIFASRTYPDFINNFRGQKFFYVPPNNKHCRTHLLGDNAPVLEDFQTIIVSAIHFAAWAGFNPIVLCSCDNAFEENRPGSIDIGDGRHIYPQHLKTYALIKGCIFWLQKHGIQVYNSSAGIDIKGCSYKRIDQIISGIENNE